MGIFWDGLEIKREEYHTDFVYLELQGELTVKNIAKLSKMMQDIVNNGFLSIQFNFNNVNYLDSSGLGLLAKFNSQIKLTIENVQPQVMEIFDITGLSKVIDVTRSDDNFHC